jgi:hypothetical protein
MSWLDGYAIFAPDIQPNGYEEPQTRYFAVICRKPFRGSNDDPIPWLVKIYRGEEIVSYWRGTSDEAEDALSEYLEGEQR